MRMKFDVCLSIEATVICLLAVCIVVPAANGEVGNDSGPRRGPVADLPAAAPRLATAANKDSSTTSAPPKPATVSPAVSPSTHPFTKGSPESANCTAGNGTECFPDTSLRAMLEKNKGMLQRAVYVLVAVTVVILIYFGLRTWSTRKRRSKAKKYGLITTPASDLEMTPLDQEDDDEDMTVFEVNGLHK